MSDCRGYDAIVIHVTQLSFTLLNAAVLAATPHLMIIVEGSCADQKIFKDGLIRRCKQWDGDQRRTVVKTQSCLRLGLEASARSILCSDRSKLCCGGSMEGWRTPFSATVRCTLRNRTVRKMSPAGFEPTTYGLKVRCSTN